jgi:hypothetical protein
MKCGTSVITSLSVLWLTMPCWLTLPAQASPHGGGHVASAPQAPHFSAPHFNEAMAPQFNQSMAPHFNQGMAPHSNQGTAPHLNQAGAMRSTGGRQGSFGGSSSSGQNVVPMGRYVNRTTTKVHALSNALQQNHAMTGHHSRSTPKGQLSQSSAIAGNSTPTSTRPAASAATSGTSAGTSTTTTPSVGSITTATPTLSNPNLSHPTLTNPSVGSVTTTTPTLTNPSVGSIATTTPTLTKPSIAPITTTTPTLTNPPVTPAPTLTPNPTLTMPSVGAITTTTPTLTNPPVGSITTTTPTLTSTGTPTPLNPVGTPSNFNLPLAVGFGLYSSGTGNQRNYFLAYPYRYSAYGYGSRYYGNSNYGNSNNSMYFAQMRRLSRLVNDLNSLNQGAAQSPAMTSRLHSDLMGVVTNNLRPPQQSVQQLSADLATVLPTRTVPAMNTGQLAQNLMAVMNAGGQNMFQMQNAVAEAQGIMSMSGVPQQGLQRISSDLIMVGSWGNRGNGMNGLLQNR